MTKTADHFVTYRSILWLAFTCLAIFSLHGQTQLINLPIEREDQDDGDELGLNVVLETNNQITIGFATAESEFAGAVAHPDYIRAIMIYADIREPDGTYIETEHLFFGLQDFAYADAAGFGAYTFLGSINQEVDGLSSVSLFLRERTDRADAISFVAGENGTTRDFMNVTFNLAHPQFDSYRDKIVEFKVLGVWHEDTQKDQLIDVVPAEGTFANFSTTSSSFIDVTYLPLSLINERLTANIDFQVVGDLDNLSYAYLDYSEDGGTTFHNLAMFRNVNSTAAIPARYQNEGFTYTQVSNSGTYQLLIEEEQRQYVENSRFITNLDEETRFLIQLDLDGHPEFSDLNNVIFRINSATRKRANYNGVNYEELITANGLTSNTLHISEEDDSYNDELDFSAQLSEEGGYVEIAIRGLNTENEFAHDWISCLSVEANNLDDKDSKIIAYLANDFQTCNTNGVRQPLTNNFAAYIPASESERTETTYEVMPNGDQYFLVRYYFDPDDLNDNILYSVYGDYLVRDLHGRQQVISGDYTLNNQTIRAGNTIMLPTITGLTATESSTVCAIDIAWDAPATIGTPSRNSVEIVRNGISLNQANNGGYTDTSVQAGTAFSYQVQAVYERDYNGSLFGEITGASTAQIAELTAPTGLALTQSDCGDDITVSWSWNTTNPTSFQLEKKAPDSSWEILATVDGSVTQFIDSNIENGVVYSYRVAAVGGICDQLGRYTDVVTLTFDAIDLSIAIDEHALSTSKGYFTDRTELFWSTSGTNDEFVHRFRIYGRELGTTVRPVLLTTLDVTELTWNHNTGGARQPLEYFVIAERVIETSCGTVVTSSFDINTLEGSQTSDGLPTDGNGVAYNIGFRNPSGVVNGSITYTGGVSVPDIRVIAEREEAHTGTSVFFDGETEVVVPHSSSLSLDTAFTLSTWIQPLNTSLGALVQKINAYSLELGPGEVLVYFDDEATGNRHILRAPFSAERLRNWTQVTSTYSANTGKLKLFLGGELIDSLVVAEGMRDIRQNTNNVFLGSGGGVFHFQGLMDETRIYHRALTDEEVLRKSGLVIPPDDSGLVAYWRMFVGHGTGVYDAAHKGSFFYQNDGVLNKATAWNNENFPSTTQLGFGSYTDHNGNYSIQGIQYGGNGENFQITPSISLGGVVHTFDPGSRVVFLGDGNSVENGLDFIDNSSFTVTGFVRYRFQNDDVPIAGANLLIDGTIVTNNDGGFVKTAEDGSFSLEMPIGEHNLSIALAGHSFEDEGIWPAQGELFDFQGDVSGIEFFSPTTKRIIGRVVGGTQEGDKILGLGKSVNNIGTASFQLNSLDGLLSVDVSTDAISGEYEVDVPPVAYQYIHPLTDQPGVQIVNNPAVSFHSDQLEVLEFDDLSDRYVIDTVRNDDGEISQIDSALFHAQRNFVYRSVPVITVVDASEGHEGLPLLGERDFTFNNKEGEEVSIPLVVDNATVLDFPVFNQFKDYQASISISEEYTNFDNNQTFFSPVQDAELVITNNIGLGSYQEGGETRYYRLPGETQERIIMNQLDGDTTYTFAPLLPNFNRVVNSPENNYTNTLAITAITGGNVVNWSGNDDGVFRAYTFGSVQSGSSNFIVRSPNIVSFILRDPPGSNSYSFLEEGTEITTTLSQSLSTGGGLDFDSKIGPSLMPSAVAFSLEIYAFATVGFNFRRNVTENNTTTSTLSTTTRFQTNDDNLTVGAQGDIYVGESQAYNYGVSQNMQLVETSLCGTDGSSGAECLQNNIVLTGDDGRSYQLGNRLGFYLDPEGQPSVFAFSQDQIENVLIPDIEALRNSVLQSNPDYTSNIPVTDPRYGTNNDNPVWGTLATSVDAITTEISGVDFDGQSYTWAVTPNQQDSVRYFNQQIRLWQDAIRQNEKEKLEVTSDNPAETFAITGGVPISSEQTNTIISTTETTWELDYQWSTGFSGGFLGGERSFTLDLMGVVTHNNTSSVSTTTGQTRSVGYVLADNDINDQHLIDVYDGLGNNGPVFYLSGGQTMCPHEPEEVTKYHSPGSHISDGTAQREKPSLAVDNSAVYNVPADESAVFNLTLQNNSETQDDQFYSLFVSDASNPDGLAFSINGEFFDGTREFLVPGGEAITQTVVVDRGPFEFDYEDIQIIMRSTCQFDPTDNDLDIADTVTVEVHYIPVCTEVRLAAPEDNWVANFRDENTLDIVIDDFNINEPGLEFIDFQFKPTENSVWQTVERFYRNSDDPDDLLIPRDNPVIAYQWDFGQLVDGNYDIRVVTSCQIASLGSSVTQNSAIHTGIIDRQNPQLFGAPEPADGVLSPNDEIMIQFNETINSGLLTPANFDIRGVLNGGALRHEAAVNFNGTGDFVQIPEGINLTRKSFSIDLQVKRRGAGAAVLFAQGINEANGVTIGFNATNQLYANVAGTQVVAADAITDENWHHLAFTFDFDRQDGILYIDGNADGINNSFAADYIELGSISIGKSQENTLFFDGFIHELRIWNRPLSLSDISIVATKRQTRTSPGLLTNWPMEEANGTIAHEKVRLLHGTVHADWQVFPIGKSLAFDGSGLASTTGFAITGEQDFTISFWVNTTSTATTLFSTGRGDAQDANINGWAFGINASGQVEARNNDLVFLISDQLINDGNWHQVSVTLNRLSTISGYVDGEEGHIADASSFVGFSGAKLWLGARGWFDGTVEETDQFFEGNLDELRIWNIHRSLGQIRQDQFSKLSGDEEGLLAYYPMEAYTESGGGVSSQTSLDNQVEESDHVLSLTGNTSSSEASPNIKLPRPVEKVNFNYSANGDRIILTPTDANSSIENTILEIAVSNVQDLNGNRLPNAITWTAFVDRNQVSWAESTLQLEKALGEELSFKASIVNAGGAVAEFTLNNLPSWLSASPTSGSLQPLSTETVTFTINEGLNIGNYDQDIYLQTDFGFDERLQLALKVTQPAPADWVVDASDYQFSMSLIGQVRIQGVLSRDEDIMVVAFVGDEVRGVGQLAYAEAFDNYQVFLSIYSNVTSGEEVKFQVWNALEGQVHTNVTPTLSFVSDTRSGSPVSPTILEATNFIRSTLDLSAGWNWVSFNLSTGDQSSVNDYLSEFRASDGDVIKNQEAFDQYDSSTGWIGNLTNSGGLVNSASYRMNVAAASSLPFEGQIVDPTTTTISLSAGWNWVGFVSQRNMTVNEALASLNPTVGDEIKGQRAFAVYSGPAFGWVGSLENLIPGQGYLMNTSADRSFTFPETGLINGGSARSITNDIGSHFGLDASRYADNMSLIAAIDGVEADTILVFSGNELRGAAISLYNPVTHRNSYFVTISGSSDGEPLKLVSLLQSQQQELTAGIPISFQANLQLGTIQNPVIFGLEEVLQSHTQELSIGSAYPNPFVDHLNITGSLTTATTVSMDLYSVDGRFVTNILERTNFQGDYSVWWDGKVDGVSIKGGLYLLQILEGNEIRTVRILKK